MLWQPSVAQHVGLALADMTVDVALFGFRHFSCACNVSKITSSDTLHLHAYRRCLWFDVWHQLDHVSVPTSSAAKPLDLFFFALFLRNVYRKVTWL